jgi:hypothetical protein
VIAEDLLLDRQHPLIDQPIAVVVYAVANLVARTHRALAHDARSISGAYIFAFDALANSCPLATGLTELGPIFIGLVVAVVVDPIAQLDAGFRLLIRDAVHLLTRPTDIAQRFGAIQRTATNNGDRPQDGQDRCRARQESTLGAAGVCLEES